MSTYEDERRSRLKSKLNPFYKPEEYGKREEDHLISCNDCGFKDRLPWKTGDQCPKCGSEQFFPYVHISNAVRVKRVVFGTLLALFIIGVNVWTTHRIVGSTTKYHIKLVCEKDELIFDKAVRIDETFPVHCQRWHWGRKTCRPAYQCAKGHTFGWTPEPVENPEQFVPTPENMLNIPKIICPVCGNDRASQMTVDISLVE